MIMIFLIVFLLIIKYIPLQQGLRPFVFCFPLIHTFIIKYIPLQQGLRLAYL